MSTKRAILIVAGLMLILAATIGHFWHKYFTLAGDSRFDDLWDYASRHWYFWLAFLLGVVLVRAGSRRHPTTSLHSTPR